MKCSEGDGRLGEEWSARLARVDAILAAVGWNFRRPGACEEATAMLLVRILGMARDSGLWATSFCVRVMASQHLSRMIGREKVGHTLN
jgi:hypothetical protein